MSYFVDAFVMNQGSTPLELLALLLFGAPDVLTLQKLLLLLTFGEANHTFTAVIAHSLYSFLILALSDSIHFFIRASSFERDSPRSFSVPSGIEKPSSSASMNFLKRESTFESASF